jgi:predicted Rossmann-fold nucleotide-binding protein
MSVASVKRALDASVRNRRRVISVIGSGVVADPRCAEVGRLIASLGFDLLTGGGRGVMEAVSRAFFDVSPRRGLVIGVVPAAVHPIEVLEQRRPQTIDYTIPPGYPNEWVEIAIYTHLPDSGQAGTLRSSRNHINVLSADAIIALPGQDGTIAEMWLAVQYGIPVIAYGDHAAGAPFGIGRARSMDEVREFLLRG